MVVRVKEDWLTGTALLLDQGDYMQLDQQGYDEYKEGEH